MRKCIRAQRDKVYSAADPSIAAGSRTGLGLGETGLINQQQDKESAHTMDIPRVYPTERDVSYDMPPIAISVESGRSQEQVVTVGVGVAEEEVSPTQQMAYQGPITVINNYYHNYLGKGGKY